MASDAGERARKALLEDGLPEEAITVNQRALIDKILARYSAEWTVFRELVQNADDAGATCCELRFESVKAKAAPSITSGATSPDTDDSVAQGASKSLALSDFKAPLEKWIFKNDGKPFGNDDWSRLRRIAEGNPDPDRIGAFGVGFYSLFSICEEPIVSSGDELMGFFWRGDALYTRRARTAAADLSPAGKPWTTFFMPLREQTPFPETPMALARFLATSLTFTTRVRKISLWFDDHLLCALDKKLSPPKSLTMPGHLNTTSAGKMMKVTALDSTALQMDCQVMRLVLAAAEKERPKPKPTALASAFTKSAGVSLTSMLQSAFGRSSNKEKDARPAPPPTPAPVEDPATTNAKMLDTVTATVHLRIATANVAVAADAAFQREIERSTKKPPPTNTAFHVIFTNKDEYDASVGEHEESGEAGARNGNTDGGVRQIFQGLLPRLDEQGHTFIGFRTHQTTGFSGHIAARFIPTVERESLDFIDRYCAKWNNELLSMGGYVARAVYEAELAEVGKLWAEMIGTGRPKDDDKGAQWLFDRALHTMRFFTFRTSSPSSRVFTVFEQSFFSCARQATITLMSTRGVKHSAAVRFPNAILADFVKDLAVLIPAHVEAAGEFVGAVRSRNLIKDVTMDDVFQELAGRALSPEEMVACLKWWISVAAHPSYDPSLRNRLLENAVISAPAPASEKEGDALPQRKEASIQALAFVRTFLNPQRVPTDVPLPESCLLYEVSKSLGAIDLNRVFDWTELSISDWLEHIVRLCNVNSSTALETNIQLSPAFAEKVFGIIARSWGSLPAHRHKEIAAILKDVPCIPTKKGMQKPGDAYFSHVSLFSDLPVVAFPTAQVKGNLEKVLVALSVRKHIELQMIFDRLVSAGDWSHVDLLGYLVTIRDSLAPLEIDRLKKTAIFPKAGEPSTVGPNGKPKLTRYRASQLYEPLDTLKALNLPLLDWSGGKPWRTTSDEAKFAFELGLQRHPPLDDLLSLASNTADAALRSGALAYFFDKYLTVYKSEYSITRASPFAFVPCQVGRSNTAQLRKPTEAFTNPEARVMDFAVVSSDLTAADVAKLQLRANPPSGQLISRLVNKPVKDEALARKIFEYLASVQEFTLHDYSVLKTAEFIPIKSKKGKGGHEEVQLVTPESAYFGSTSGSSTPQFKDLFIYCDFGPKGGAFLRNCGVTNEPSIEEVARKLVSEPDRFYSLAGSVDAYIGILRQIAANWNRIRAPLRSEMKRSAFLLGSKRVKQTTKSDIKDEEEDDEPGMLVHALKRPSEVVIVDDANSHMLFASSLFFAPHEDLLEDGLYEQLGSVRLSSLVQEKYEALGNLLDSTPRAHQVRSLVLERTPLFLFEKRHSAKGDIRHDADWLKNALEVVEVDGGGLRLTRHLRFGTLEDVNRQSASAMASMRGKRLTLFIASNLEIDWFEVAMALNKFLLNRQRLQEVLLFMTLLSTSLRNLKRRGFHVDKILSQRKAEREAAEQKAREEKLEADMEALRPKPSAAELEDWKRQLLAVFPDADEGYVERLLASQKENHVNNATNAMLETPYTRKPSQHTSAPAPAPIQPGAAGNRTGSFLSGWKNRFIQRAPEQSSLASGTSSIVEKGGQDFPGGWGEQPAPTPVSASARAMRPQQPDAPSQGVGGGKGPLSSGGRLPDPHAQVTPTSNIKNNVLRAISASRSDSSNVIKTQGQKAEVKEASNTYCDTTAGTDLRLAGEVAGLKVFLSPQLDAIDVLERNADALRRLIDQVYKPVAKIFGLDPRSINVFCDTEGPTIAFNRGGTIYLNLRYYLAWHDELVKKGDLQEPLISTFFTVSHEIAHNVVAQHDSEHEFYFSSISEQFMMPLANYISSLSAASTVSAASST